MKQEFLLKANICVGNSMISVQFFQVGRETVLLLINNIH
jgi:hypothetical protein